MTCILAIDPGLTGALAFLFTDHPERVSIEDMPVVAGVVDVATLADRIRQFKPDVAIVEAVGPMPTDGAVQAFKFGGAYRAARAVVTLLEIPVHAVTPVEWKRHFRLPGKGKGGAEASRALALQRFPASAKHFARKMDHNRADASLLAMFGMEVVLVRSGHMISNGLAQAGGATGEATASPSFPLEKSIAAGLPV